ncbi:MAG TPA: hypothetical protein ENG42_01845 [Candidatus Aenigmarchaeota archaeon]|nr:MAG: hypothetical protein DRP03_02910 [Candidatus Aenigmarchaeota archaeon]HDD46191.1 hypothetical protein [Candidatus Aenigmarchaeota archaeon]
MRDRLKVLDTTLRDGMQTPKIGVDEWGRFVIAKALAYVGVDVIEAGFAANEIDYPTLRRVSKYIGSRERSMLEHVPVICSLARLVKDDIELAYDSIRLADPDKRRIHVFIGTSKELMEYSHGKREKEIIGMIRDGVSIARELMGEHGTVEYSSEDALRTDYEFLAKTVEEAIRHGADVINVPDTTGFARPDQYYDIIKKLREEVRGIENVTLSAHIHNDSGNAVATTLKGIEAGVRQVEGCVLQLGERAGNVDWLVVIENLRVHEDFYGIDTNHIKTEKFFELAQLVSNVIGKPLPLNHPVSGEVAFTTSSGIHVKGVIKNRKTYHVIEPESVGRGSEIVLGQTSGRNTVANFLREHGYGEACIDYNAKQLEELTRRAKKMSIKLGGSLSETEAMLLAEEILGGASPEDAVELIDYVVEGSKYDKPRVNAVVKVNENVVSSKGYGVGPVDAFMNAIKNATGLEIELRNWEENAIYRGMGAPGFEILDEIPFNEEERAFIEKGRNGKNNYMSKVSKGQEAWAKSRVEISYKGQSYFGRGVAQNILESTYNAIIDAVNAIVKLNRF